MTSREPCHIPDGKTTGKMMRHWDGFIHHEVQNINARPGGSNGNDVSIKEKQKLNEFRGDRTGISCKTKSLDRTHLDGFIHHEVAARFLSSSWS